MTTHVTCATAGERERHLAEVLWRFEQAHPLPSGVDTERWAAEHPDFADDILAYAVVKAELFLACDEDDNEDDGEDDDEDGDLREAEDEILAVLRPGPDAKDLSDLVAGAGQDLRGLAERLDVEVGVLERVASGRFSGAMPTMIVYALADALGQGVLDVVKAINAGVARHRPDGADAIGDPAGRPLASIDEVVEASGMTAERKRYWLRND